MGGSIYGAGVGTINFDDDIWWVTKRQADQSISEKRALDGSLVQSWLTSQSVEDELHTFRFTWVDSSLLDSLDTIRRNRSSFYLKTSSTATPIVCRFAKSGGINEKPVAGEDFFSPDAVEGGNLDSYNGEMKLIVRM